MNNKNKKEAFALILIPFGIFASLIAVVLIFMSMSMIPAGQVGVSTLFGKVNNKIYPEGLHFIHPLASMNVYDVRQKTHKEVVMVPSQDQLTTSIDFSVQYRLDQSMVLDIIKETGNPKQAIDVHLIPRLRSLVREQAKSIKKAEDFFKEETQQLIQQNVTFSLSEEVKESGIIVQDVLIRDIKLPDFIEKAIEDKKTREQQAERQKAELERFKTEQEQKIATAEAELKAAESEAEKKRVLADAQAYEIQKINEAISGSPAYIQLKALDSLKEISKDPASKLYFLNGDSPNPLPLMHLGNDK